MRKNAPPPPDILRKSGPHKDRTKYDRKRVRQDDKKLDQGPETDKGPPQDSQA
jgi:hypothetical protein